MTHIAITAIRGFLSTIVDAVTGHSKIDPNNSTTDILLAGATFTGEKVSLLGSATVSINIYADQDSATDGMKFEFSSDGVNWDDQEQIFNLDAAVSKARRFQYGVNHAWFRVIYVNGAVDQTAFRLQTILHRSSQITTIHRLIDEESPDRSATLVKAVLMARKAGVGELININSTAGGNLKVSFEEVETGVVLPTVGITDKILNTITTSDAAVYAPGDNIGGIITMTDALRTTGGTALLHDIAIWDKDKQNAILEIDYWSESPSGTYTDNAAQVIAGDEDKHLGTIEIAAGDYKETGAVSKLSLRNLGLTFKGVTKDLFMTIKLVSGTPTYTSTSGLIVKNGLLQD